MAPTAKEKVGEVLDSGYIGQGPKVDEFEKQLGEYFGNKKVVTTNAAEHRCFTSSIITLIEKTKRKLDRRISWCNVVEHNWVFKMVMKFLATPLTCTASNCSIVANNLKIKWVDIDPTTLNMDLEDLEKKDDSKTKAIMGVHWGGYPLDLDEIRNIRGRFRKEHGWAMALIEDGIHIQLVQNIKESI